MLIVSAENSFQATRPVTKFFPQFDARRPRVSAHDGEFSMPSFHSGKKDTDWKQELR
jgi:hypothetical protein